MENGKKYTLYDLHNLNGPFISNYKLSDEQGPIKKIGLSEVTVVGGALKNVSGMLSNTMSTVTQNSTQAPVVNSELQPASPESVQANNSPSVEVGLPAYGVPVEQTVAVTPNMFENPLEGVYSEAKNFMNSPESTNTYNNTVIEPQMNVNQVETPVVEQTPIVLEKQNDSLGTVSDVGVPVQPVSEVQAPMIDNVVPMVNDMPKMPEVNQMPAEQIQSESAVNTVSNIVPLFEEKKEEKTNEMPYQIAQTDINQGVPAVPNVPVQENIESPIPNVINNELASEIVPEVKEKTNDINAEIDEVVVAIDNAREKLIMLKEKLNQKNVGDNKEAEIKNTIVPEVPSIPETPMVNPTMQNDIPNINSYFGRAA